MAKKQKKRSNRKTDAVRLSPEQRKQIMHTMQVAVGLHRQGQLQQAEQLYRKVLGLNPGHLDAQQFLAAIAQQMGHTGPALELFEQVAEADPKRFQAYFSIGKLRAQLGQRKEAIQAYRTCLKIKPDLIEGWNNLGLLYKEGHRYAKAVDCFQRVVSKQPDNGMCWSNLGNALKDCGRMDEAVSALSKAAKVQPGLSAAYSNYLLALNYLPDLAPAEVARQHHEWSNYVPASISASRFRFPRDRFEPERPLRVGYVSPDFHRHSVAFFLEAVFQHHSEACEMYAYDCNDKHDAVNRRLRAHAKQWREVKHTSDIELANLIYEDRIDVLVDLCGHMADNRLTVFLQKPAPVQMTWLGYPNTSGLAEMDYRITDAVADPEGESDSLHSESLLRLANGFLCYLGDEAIVANDILPSQRCGMFTFGSFNNTVKMTEKVIQTWARILKAVPGSRLLLKSAQLESKELRERVLSYFSESGIEASRIELCGLIAETASHLKKYDEVDLALDTFPYNGTTTSCEAMWMGVPTLCLRGNSHASRVGASLMHHVGLDQFIADSVDDYVAMAVSLAQQPAQLKSLRPALRKKMLASSLCDGAGFTRELEGAFRFAWRKACEE